MEKVFSLIVSLMVVSILSASAQTDSLKLIGLNQQIDDLVVKQDAKTLEGLYADDFVFSHGSGKVEGKMTWLKTVGRTVYPSRQHDSVRVEMHPGIAIVKGKMAIRRNDKDKVAIYHLRYIRVYALRGKQWQMISHSTTEEKHEN